MKYIINRPQTEENDIDHVTSSVTRSDPTSNDGGIEDINGSENDTVPIAALNETSAEIVRIGKKQPSKGRVAATLTYRPTLEPCTF